MKEKLYTIPLNDAINADDECPFCFIERNVEQDLLDFTLGSGSSYMESDVREATDKAGFCREHFKKMFDYGNTLGNGWILKTHYIQMIREMKEQFHSYKPGKTSFKDKFKKQTERTNPIGIWVTEKENSCYICNRFRDTYDRYMDTFFVMYKKDEEFRQKILAEDVSWLVDKFDYRNKDADWKNSKDAIQRGMQKLKGGYPADAPYKMNK